MKLPFDSLREKKSRKGKKAFSVSSESKEESSAESAPPGAHRKKKKRRKLKKKVVIPVVLVVVLVGAFGVRHFFAVWKGRGDANLHRERSIPTGYPADAVRNRHH